MYGFARSLLMWVVNILFIDLSVDMVIGPLNVLLLFGYYELYNEELYVLLRSPQ